MHFKFQSFVDVSTSAESMQIFQWSVGGAEVLNRCRHLFGAYKYFKLGRIDVKMVPASTLPVDPQGLSYDEDDPQTVDPRDQMTPGAVRITNGEDIFTNVSALSDEQQEAMMNSIILDPRWSKFMLQSGFRRSALPLYWQVGQLQQDRYPGATINVPYVPDVLGQHGVVPDGVLAQHVYKTVVSDAVAVRTNAGSSGNGLFQVGHRGRLGWLPTDGYQEIPNATDDRFHGQSYINNIPSVRVITCCLPKAHKTLYYYRIFITEHVYFSGLRSMPPFYSIDGGSGMINSPDQFIYPSLGTINPGVRYGTEYLDEDMNNGDQQI